MRLPGPGELFEGRYRIERELGVGGFSRVYMVREETSGRVEALKVLLPEEDGYAPDVRARFDREVQTIAKLQHPNTVTLYNCGVSRDGLLFMVFEYVPGEDLADLLEREGRLDGATVRNILVQLLGALREAHDAGLVHRDIKPENVRVCSAPGEPIEVKLLDFGIARPTDDGSPSLTKTGQLIGTPRYMSPEQLKEMPLTPASDIYSLGMVALELLVGRDALHGNRWSDQLERLRTGHVFSVPLIEAASPELVALIPRMTALDPGQRIASAQAALAALDSPGGPASTARGPSYTRERRALAPPPPQQRSWYWPVAFAVLLIAGVGAAMLLLRDVQRASAPPAPKPSNTSAGVALLKEPDAALDREPGPDVGVDAAVAFDASPPPPARSGCGITSPQPLANIKMFAPKRYDAKQPTPLIIWLYSHNQLDHDMAIRAPAFQRLLERERVLVAVPIAPLRADLKSWTEDHVDHLASVRDAVAAEYCVDAGRVYVWASAGGGLLGTRMACESWPAGVVVSTFMEHAGAQYPCPNPRPLLWIAARHSQHQPMKGGPDCGGGTRRAFVDALDHAAEARGCDVTPAMTLERDYVGCLRWGCEVPFETCEVNGGLGWPGTPQPENAQILQMACAEPPPNQEFDAARHAWDFFESLTKKP